MTNEALENCIDRLRAGDRDGFDELYKSTYKGVYFTVLSVLKDVSLVEDVVQNTYMITLQKLDHYTPNTNFKAWICRVAHNLALNELRKRSREVQVDYQENELIAGSYHFNEEVDTPVIKLASRVLREDEFKILMLCEIAGFKRKEVAEIFHMSISTVTWKYLNALKKMRVALEKKGGEYK